MNARLRLIIAAVAFFGWLGYLSYAAVTKSHAPVVSHTQAAAVTASVQVRAPDGARTTATPAAAALTASAVKETAGEMFGTFGDRC